MARIWTAIEQSEAKTTLAKDAIKGVFYIDSNLQKVEATSQPSKKTVGAFLFKADGGKVAALAGDEVLTQPGGLRLAAPSLPTLKELLNATKSGRYEVRRYTVKGQDGLIALYCGKLPADGQTGEGFYNVVDGKTKKERE